MVGGGFTVYKPDNAPVGGAVACKLGRSQRFHHAVRFAVPY